MSIQMEMLLWQIVRESTAQGRNMGQKYEFESGQQGESIKILETQ